MLHYLTHIVLLGNRYDHLLLLQNCIQALQPHARVDIADLFTLTSLVRRQCPDMILLYVTATENVHRDYVHKIRNNRMADNIPLIVCQAPLEMRQLKAILGMPDEEGDHII